jgi:hypothetical protein
MSFSAVVKDTGEILLAHGEAGEDGAVHLATPPIRPHLSYSGMLLQNVVRIDDSTWQYGDFVPGCFDGDQLELIPLDAELRFKRRPA